MHKKFAKVPVWALAVILVAAVALVGYNSVSASPSLTSGQSAAQIQQDDQQGAKSRGEAMKAGQEKMLARVAEILGIDADKVQAAFEQARQEEMKAMQEKMKAGQEKMKAAQEERLAEVADKLGVSADALIAAHDAALKSLKESRASGQNTEVTPPPPPAIEGKQPPSWNVPPPCGRPGGELRKGAPDMSAFYSKIAESLGNGMTAEKVKAAFEETRQEMRPAAEAK